MANIQDFVQMAVQNLGITEQTAQGAAGGILQTIKGKVSGGDFQQLLGGLEGAEGLLGQAPQAEGQKGGGGILGKVIGAAASAFGGKGGSALNLAGLLAGAGLSADKLGPFVSLFMNFAKQHLDSGLVSRLLGQLPDLQNLAGE
jgi:hypothetical protein